MPECKGCDWLYNSCLSARAHRLRSTRGYPGMNVPVPAPFLQPPPIASNTSTPQAEAHALDRLGSLDRLAGRHADQVGVDASHPSPVQRVLLNGVDINRLIKKLEYGSYTICCYLPLLSVFSVGCSGLQVDDGPEGERERLRDEFWSLTWGDVAEQTGIGLDLGKVMGLDLRGSSGCGQDLAEQFGTAP